MSHRAGIWIDHQRAVNVSVSAGRVTTKPLESEVGAHPRYSGQQDDGGESKTFFELTVDIETADKLTDPQIEARVKEHFRIDR